MGLSEDATRHEVAVEQQEYRAARRKREFRDTLAGRTFVLDDFEPAIGEVASTAEVCALLKVDASTTLRNVTRRHGDELAADGWNQTKGTYTRRAIIRVALMLRGQTSPRAGLIAEALGARKRPLKFAGGDELANVRHIRQCQVFVAKAFEAVERIRDDDPAELWADLNDLDVYSLQGLVMALAALVPDDTRGLGDWLRAFKVGVRPRAEGGLASGLSLLVPTKESADGGIPVGRLDDAEEPAA
jgi:hypothetical protein